MAFRNAESEAGRITFTRASAARIANAVQVVESQRPAAQPLTFNRIETAKKVFRVATFTGAWSIAGIKNVRFIHNTNQTAQAVNLFANITAAAGTRECAIARDGTAWYLIAARC